MKIENNKNIQENDMSQSLCKNLIHIVFSTKERQAILDKEICQELYLYIGKLLTNLNCHAYQIGGMPDHLHILCAIAKNITVQKLIEEIKKNSSKWIKTKGEKYTNFYWQSGYGVFSVSPLHLKTVSNYIATQESHHCKNTFKNELLLFFNKYSIEYDERYLWD